MDRIILSHNSALAALRALPPQTGRLTRVEEPLRLAEIRTSAKTLADALPRWTANAPSSG